MEDPVVIARIVKTRGLRGEVVADILTDFPERFEGLDDVTVRPVTGGGSRKMKIEKFWFQKGRVILKFAGLDTIDDAEELRDHDVCVPEEDAVELDDDEFFDWQLSGCRVETVDGAELGEVTEVMRTGGTEILVVRGGGKEFLIPFARSICTDVDIENKSIRIDPPEGLLEF